MIKNGMGQSDAINVQFQEHLQNIKHMMIKE